MFLSNSIKYPLLPVVSSLSSNMRLIHVASQNCIRRKLVKYAEPEAESQYYEKEVEVSPSKLNPNVNFYGIDSDEGTILINSKNFENVEQNNNQKSKEKFLRSSFGVIRQDLDNKIQSHGQYDSDINSAFPHRSTDLAQVSGNIHQIKSSIFNVLNNDNINRMNENGNDKSLMKAYPVKNSHLNSLYNDDVKKEKPNSFINMNSVQYIDKDIVSSDAKSGNFAETYNSKLKTSPYEEVLAASTGNFKSSISNNEIQNKHKLNSSSNERKVNYIDECFFEDVHDKDNFIKCDDAKSNHHEECLSYDSNSDIKFTPFTDATTENSDSPLQPVNYFEKLFFPNLDESNSSAKNLSLTNSDEKQLSHIDENYFGNILEDKKSTNEENYQQNIETSCRLPLDNIVIPDTFSQCEIAQEISESGTKHFISEKTKSNNIDKQFHISQTEKDASLAEMSVKEHLQTHIVSEHQVSENTSDNTSSSNVLNLNSMEKRPAFSESFNEVSALQHLTNKQNSPYASTDHISKTKKSGIDMEHLKTPNCIYPNVGISESVTNLNSNKRLNDISQNLEMPKFVDKTQFSESRSTSNTSVTNNVHTAYNLVMEMRKKQESRTEKDQKEASPKNSVKAEKLDSKGFRILKNQVPDFSHFTREEVLDILKESIIYSDDNLLILNKPYSLIMHESQTTKLPCLSSFLDNLAKDLDKQAADPKLFTVHRLDKETTGCLLLARNEITAQNLKSLFAQRKIIKKYWILTTRVPDPLKGVIDIPISEGSISGKQRMVLHPNLPKDIRYKSHSKSGKRAVTSYKVLCISGNAALVEATPETGIKHQIRVHFGFGLSCPILGDHKYSHINKLAPQKLASDLLQRLHVRQSKVRYIPMHIHSKSILIPNYFEGRDLFVMAPLPNHMISNLKKLKFKKKNQLSL